MERATALSPAQCILLALSLATEADISTLRNLISHRSDVFDLELVLRILLKYLPETVEPEAYIDFLTELVAQPSPEGLGHGHTTPTQPSIDCSSVSSLSAKDAREKLRQSFLPPLHDTEGSDASRAVLRCAPEDHLVQFLVNRAHAIDRETGMLPAISRLLRPFLNHSTYLRTWYISCILPLMRFEYDYYPEREPALGLDTFEDLEGADAITMLMSKSVAASREGNATAETVARDLKGLVGPWTYGSTQRKRRKLGGQTSERHTTKDETNDTTDPGCRDEHWDDTLMWIIDTATNNFPLAVAAIEGWNGPPDIDLDEDDAEGRSEHLIADAHMHDAIQRRYCQAGFGAVYVTEKGDVKTIEGAHRILTRLAFLLRFEPPPELATPVDLLPQINEKETLWAEMPGDLLQSESLMKPDHPLTSPGLPAFGLLQMFTHSAYLLSQLRCPIAILSVAKLYFFGDTSDTLRFLQRIVQSLVDGPQQSSEDWSYTRQIITWLWAWGLDQRPNGPKEGHGVFGRLTRATVEKEILKAFCSVEQYALVSQIYLEPQAAPLKLHEAEEVILSLTYTFYDAASNGNRTRGGMKRASTLLAAFRPSFSDSLPYRQASALIAATHALSFYTLTLEQGVPTKPATIRQTRDPLSLLNILLSQNPNSYTNLDDLISIGQNLTIAIPTTSSSNDLTDLTALTVAAAARLDSNTSSSDHSASESQATARRITSMAIESALSSDDFETAYSYVVNRLSSLTPASAATTTTITTNNNSTTPKRSQSLSQSDPLAAHAALMAGKHPSPSTSATNDSFPIPAQIRRLDQRRDLLAHALLLSPPSQLPETLAAWRRCEEELLTLLASEAAAEREADDAADRGSVNMDFLPGTFGGAGEESGGIFGRSQQSGRREVGRAAVEEAPMGLFEVARGAARALSRNTTTAAAASASASANANTGSPSKAMKRSSTVRGGQSGGLHDERFDDDGKGQEVGEEEEEEGEWEREERVRKRDVVASAVTGGFARGVGWVLGAAPVGDAGSPGGSGSGGGVGGVRG